MLFMNIIKLPGYFRSMCVKINEVLIEKSRCRFVFVFLTICSKALALFVQYSLLVYVISCSFENRVEFCASQHSSNKRSNVHTPHAL